MSRPLRLHYPYAQYHVMNRGRRGEVIYTDRVDYTAFLAILKEAVELWKARIGA